MIFVKLIANIFSYCAKPCRRSDVFDWISIFLFLYHSYSILSPLSLFHSHILSLSFTLSIVLALSLTPSTVSLFHTLFFIISHHPHTLSQNISLLTLAHPLAFFSQSLKFSPPFTVALTLSKSFLLILSLTPCIHRCHSLAL